MRAMVLTSPRTALQWTELPDRSPGPDEIRVKVHACGVCRTDLHVIDGELANPKLPLIPGHEVVGRIDAMGAEVALGLNIGDRVGIPWLAHTCGVCSYCIHGHENLCDDPQFTGYTRDGGFATSVIANARYAFPLPDGYSDEALAPLLCAGLIGWRALVRAGSAEHIGLYGFGAAAHLMAQVAQWQGRTIYALTRAGDTSSQAFARSLGAAWAGDSTQLPPRPLDAAIIFAPDGTLIPQALRAVRKGGRVVCAGIHMSAIPSFSYDLLWGEREVVSVANLTRQDGIDFLSSVPHWHITTHTTPYPMQRANEALGDLRAGRFDGAAVLIPA
jgi:propanol-preferring alcohol dehydrogenase